MILEITKQYSDFKLSLSKHRVNKYMSHDFLVVYFIILLLSIILKIINLSLQL